MHDGPLGAGDRLIGAADQRLARLCQHLDGDVVGNEVLVDQQAQEVVIGLRGGREADLDLLEAHADQQVEESALALGAHGLDQRLVAVAQIDRAPDRRGVDHRRRPAPVGQIDGGKRTVLVARSDSHGSKTPHRPPAILPLEGRAGRQKSRHRVGWGAAAQTAAGRPPRADGRR